MVVLLQTVVKLCFLDIEFKADDVQDFQEPADGKRVSRKLEHVKVLNHAVVDFLEFLHLII